MALIVELSVAGEGPSFCRGLHLMKDTKPLEIAIDARHFLVAAVQRMSLVLATNLSDAVLLGMTNSDQV